MTELSAFPITAKWPAQHPERLQLYSLPTPNGVNNKIPAIIDPDGPDGKPLGLFESGAILLYLADKTGQFIPRTPRAVTRRSSG